MNRSLGFSCQGKCRYHLAEEGISTPKNRRPFDIKEIAFSHWARSGFRSYLALFYLYPSGFPGGCRFRPVSGDLTVSERDAECLSPGLKYSGRGHKMRRSGPARLFWGSLQFPHRGAINSLQDWHSCVIKFDVLAGCRPIDVCERLAASSVLQAVMGAGRGNGRRSPGLFLPG